MSKKTDQFGRIRNPKECYAHFKQSGLAEFWHTTNSKAWKRLQKEFKKRKRLRKISRLMRKGKHPKRNMRPVL
jgi:hypothetical protein